MRNLCKHCFVPKVLSFETYSRIYQITGSYLGIDVELSHSSMFVYLFTYLCVYVFIYLSVYPYTPYSIKNTPKFNCKICLDVLMVYKKLSEEEQHTSKTVEQIATSLYTVDG